MRIRRLGWAGVELESSGSIAVIDLFEDVGPMRRFVGDPKEPLPGPSGPVALALVTHLHSDHTDPAALARALAPDGVLLRPAPAEGEGLETIATAAAEAGLEQAALPARVVRLWETVAAGPFRATAVPAVDGFGDPQVSWLVEADGRRVLHCGDTLFHGSWWLVKMRLGPVDVALLPVNGPLVDLPHRQPASPIEAAMNPRQAAAAAAILEAGVAVPIHYDGLNNPPTYAQVDDPSGAFAAEAERLGVATRVLGVGEALAVASGDARGDGVGVATGG